MRKKFIARTAKLLSEARRNKFHQGVAITYEHIPTDGDERNHGSIYALINVNTDSKAAEEVAESIIDTFHGEYYNDLNRDPLASFESAIAKVNEELAEITHQGNINWINKLNAVLAVLADTTIHVTQAGKAEAFLYRNGRSKHITQELTGDNINPLRTFSDMAIGELVEGDKVAMVTPDIFYHISKNELQKYVEEFQPKIAISHLADILEGTAAYVKPNAILILEAITAEAASGESMGELTDEIWIEEPSRTVETVVENSAPFVKKFFQYIKLGVETVGVFFTNTVIPKASQYSSGAYNEVKGLIENRGLTKEQHIDFGEEVNAPETKIDEPRPTLEDLNIHENANELVEKNKPNDSKNIYIKETTNKPKWLKIEKINLGAVKKIGHHSAKYYKKLRSNKINFAIAATLLFLILAGSIYSTWQANESSEQKKLATATLSEARNKYELANSYINNGERKKASETLHNALDIAKSITQKDLKAEAEALTGDINKSIDIAEGTTRPEITKLGDTASMAGDKPFGPFLINESLYLINSENGSTVAVDTKSGEVSNIIEKPKYEGKITAAAAVSARSTLVFFTDKGLVYEIDTKDIVINKQETTGEIENPASLTVFSTNLYTLEASTGKVYKRLKSSSGYTKRTDYITDSSVVTGSKSIAIDSNLYVLDASGNLIKYLSGKKQNFEIKDSPVNLGDANAVFANEDVKDLYLLSSEKGKVYRIDSEGKYLGQYAGDQILNATGIYTDDTTASTYFVKDGSLYKFKV